MPPNGAVSEETNHVGCSDVLIEALWSVRQACADAVVRDDKDDAGDIATPETCVDYEM